MALTPHPLIRFALEYMHWKALLRDFPLDGVLSMTTRDSWLTIPVCCGQHMSSNVFLSIRGIFPRALIVAFVIPLRLNLPPNNAGEGKEDMAKLYLIEE
jgi:hypothetical protein